MVSRGGFGRAAGSFIGIGSPATTTRATAPVGEDSPGRLRRRAPAGLAFRRRQAEQAVEVVGRKFVLRYVAELPVAAAGDPCLGAHRQDRVVAGELLAGQQPD